METGRACSIEGCEGKVKSRGWCNMHYRRWLKHGDPLKTAFERASTIREAFDLRTQWTEEGCLEWTGARFETGYGAVRFRGETWYAHRVAWTLVNGEISPDRVMNHRCWNRACVNVDHLEEVTYSENNTYRSEARSDSIYSSARNVTFHPEMGKWFSRVRWKGETFRGPWRDTEEEAKLDAKCLRDKHFGRFAGKG